MNLNKNSISIIIPSIHPERWPKIIENYKSKNVFVEILFIGPTSNNLFLPNNVKYIKTNFKVTQCLEIGLRSASSYYVLQSGDDCYIKGSNDPLADMVKAANLYPNNLICIKYAVNGILLSRNEINLVSNEPKTLIPINAILSKKMIDEVGGYNANYIASYSDIDLFLRIKNSKYRYRWLDIYMDEERPENLGLSQLSFRYLGHDIKYLKYNWVQNDIVTKKYTLRNRSIENFKPFDQNTLLTKEQGKGTSKIFKNKLFIILMSYKFFRYGVLVFYKIYRKFIIKAKFY